jgi:hypothetical protein
MEKRKSIVFGLFLLSLALVLTACGGGDGGGSGGGVSGGGISYTGITAQATVDSTNSKTLSTGAYKGGAAGTSGSMANVQEKAVSRPNYLDLALTIEEAIRHIDMNAPPGVVDAGAIARESGTISGHCGGNAQYVIQYDDATGDFSGTLNFSSYCSQGVTLAGSASFSGRIDVNTKNLLQFSLSCDDMTVTTGSDSFTAKMSISSNFQASPITVAIDILLRDNTNRKVYWVNNYIIALWVGSNYVDFQVSGKYYHPDYGYVSISTSTTFRIYFGATWPSQGILILDGKTGIAGGSTRAQLTVLSSTTYQVEADANGDSIYEWNSGPLNWP